MKRFVFFLFVLPLALPAAPPAALASALEYLRDQHSYSWEVINSDPGPVAQEVKTRRGTITTVQRSLSPHIKGTLGLNGEIFLQRDWPDGVQLDTFIATDGTMVTKTPEGWMNDREILSAQAEERLREGKPGERFAWLRRADRPDVQRPNQELVSLLKSTLPFEQIASDTYLVQSRARTPDISQPIDNDGQPGFDVSVTLHLRGGIIRDYEVAVEGSRRVTRAHLEVPISDRRIVILSYVPKAKVDVPVEAREKLKASKTAPR